MSKQPTCGVGFHLQYPPFYGELSCELDRYHDEPHEALGFVWGPKDQSLDFMVQQLRAADERRRERSRKWYGRLRGKR